jgi:hypothetical protein
LLLLLSLLLLLLLLLLAVLLTLCCCCFLLEYLNEHSKQGTRLVETSRVATILRKFKCSAKRASILRKTAKLPLTYITLNIQLLVGTCAMKEPLLFLEHIRATAMFC